MSCLHGLHVVAPWQDLPPVGSCHKVVIFLSNVLIAQIIGAYSSLYDRMLGLARLNRSPDNQGCQILSDTCDF